MTLPPIYQIVILVMSVALVGLFAAVVARTTREYHALGDARSAWALASRMATLVACLGLLVSATGFFVPPSDGQAVANFGLGLVRAGLLIAGIALLVQGGRLTK